MNDDDKLADEQQDDEKDTDARELAALAAIIEILKQLDSHPALERIVNYLMDRFDLWDDY